MNNIFLYANLVVRLTFVCPQTTNGDSKFIGNPRKTRATCGAACNFITNHQTFHAPVVFNSYFPPAHCGAGPCKNGTTDNTVVPPPEDPAPTPGPTSTAESNSYSELKEPWMQNIITSSERNVMDNCGCGLKYGNGKPTLEVSGRIVNGNGTFDNEYPWMTNLRIGKRDENDNLSYERCGGAIINDLYILTAAHCMVNQTPGKWRTVRNVEDTIGRIMTRNVEAPTAEISFEKVIVHPGFLAYDPAESLTPFSYRYDIAILKLKKRLILDETPNLKPVCLPESDDVNDIYEGRKATLVGWGLTSKGENAMLSNLLLQTTLEMHNSSTCDKLLGGDASLFVCAQDSFNSEGAAPGDSGGPLCIMDAKKLTQIGVVSFSWSDSLGVYSNVMSFLPFIDYYSSQSGAMWCQR